MDDLRQSRPYQELHRRFGGIVEDIGGGEVGYISRLSFARFVRMMVVQYVQDPNVLPAVDRISRQHRTVFVKLAPKAEEGTKEAAIWEESLRRHGFSVDKSSIVPTKSLVVDLRPSEDDILMQMKPKTRYNVRLSHRRGVTARAIDGNTIVKDDDYLDQFHWVYQENCRRNGTESAPRPFFERLFETFGDDLFVVFAYTDSGEPGAVACYMVTGNTVWYQMNGATDEGRRAFATNRVVWEGMLQGKERGCTWFDFDGIYDERYDDDDWKGFTRFKLGFGGEEVTYMGSYVKWFPFLRR